MLEQLSHYKWALEASAFFVIMLLAHFFTHYLLNKLEKVRVSSSWRFGKEIVLALHSPLFFLLWTMGAFYLTDLVISHFVEFDFIAQTAVFRRLILIAALLWFLFRWKAYLEKDFLDKVLAGSAVTYDVHSVTAISKVASIVFTVLSVLMALSTLGIGISSVLAFGGFGSIVIGFASQDVVANLFGGFMIYMNRPFSILDRIAIPEKKLDGFVDQIGWYQTKIISLDKRPIYVPNSIFPKAILENWTRMSNRRIKENIGIRYDDFDKVEGIVEAIKSYLDAHPELDKSKSIYTNFTSYGAYSLNIYISAFTLSTFFQDYLRIKQEILLELGKMITEAKAEIAFPTTVAEFSKPLEIKNTVS